MSYKNNSYTHIPRYIYEIYTSSTLYYVVNAQKLQIYIYFSNDRINIKYLDDYE